MQGNSENLGVGRAAGHHHPVEAPAIPVVIEIGILLDEAALQLNRETLVDLHDFVVSRRPVELGELHEKVAIRGLRGALLKVFPGKLGVVVGIE